MLEVAELVEERTATTDVRKAENRLIIVEMPVIWSPEEVLPANRTTKLMPAEQEVADGETATTAKLDRALYLGDIQRRLEEMHLLADLVRFGAR